MYTNIEDYNNEPKAHIHATCISSINYTPSPPTHTDNLWLYKANAILHKNPISKFALQY